VVTRARVGAWGAAAANKRLPGPQEPRWELPKGGAPAQVVPVVRQRGEERKHKQAN